MSETAASPSAAAGASQVAFQAEVSRLLDIVANALYSKHEVFLRELISNSSDACDKLRYLAVTQPELTKDDPNFRIRLSVDEPAGTLTIADNGIGMDREELIANLGTIAKSGTGAFMQGLAQAETDESRLNLIGQFGVGFYSSFMVADRVVVLSRRAGSLEAWRWESDGKGTFTVTPAPTETPRGTQVTLHLKDDRKEYLDPTRLRHVVETYSDHIDLPIILAGADQEETLNRASALWSRPKSDITAEQYKEFYHHVAHVFDDPWLTLHNQVEGLIEYTNLLFIPSSRPFDLFDPRRRNHLKLYVRRVFITDDVDELLPAYLRFVRGVVDCADLPLNISREMLQTNPVVAKIRSGLTKRILSELEKQARDPAKFKTFWDTFGPTLKEGLYEDWENRDTLFRVCRFHSTHATDQMTSLEDYLSRMKEGQEAIYVLTGDDLSVLRTSPHLEGFRAKGVEVLLLDDRIDEFWLTNATAFEGKTFKSITRAGGDLAGIKSATAADVQEAETADETAAAPLPEGLDALVARAKEVLGPLVKDVRTSDVLTESAVRLAADEGDIDMHLARMLRETGQLPEEAKRILELNPKHALIRGLASRQQADTADPVVGETLSLLLDQALVVEGEPLPDTAAFARRLAAAAARGLV